MADDPRYHEVLEFICGGTSCPPACVEQVEGQYSIFASHIRLHWVALRSLPIPDPEGSLRIHPPLRWCGPFLQISPTGGKLVGDLGPSLCQLSLPPRPLQFDSLIVVFFFFLPSCGGLICPSKGGASALVHIDFSTVWFALGFFNKLLKRWGSNPEHPDHTSRRVPTELCKFYISYKQYIYKLFVVTM